MQETTDASTTEDKAAHGVFVLLVEKNSAQNALLLCRDCCLLNAVDDHSTSRLVDSWP